LRLAMAGAVMLTTSTVAAAPVAAALVAAPAGAAPQPRPPAAPAQPASPPSADRSLAASRQPPDPSGAFLRSRSGRFTPLGGVPRAAMAAHFNLNNRGQVVGLWDDEGATLANEPGSRHGFVWDDGRLRKFDAPGSLSTGALGINNAGQVTGSFDDTAGHHGFLLRRDRFSTIDAPGRTVTDAWGINDLGEIVIPDLGTGLSPVTRP
jgi:hypothetical protein